LCYKNKKGAIMKLILQQAKAQSALSRMRQQASERGIARATPQAIEAEIRAVRRKRNSL
jgi:hypothetical protein